MSQASFKKRLKALMNRPENQVCSDCPERQPRWASLIVPPPGSAPGSLPIGAFCCLECSGSHRRLGVHISFVRSITLDSWKEKEVLAMENGGNAKVNAIFEANLTVSKPSTAASGPVRERFIRDKYERRKYYDPAALRQYQESADNSSSDESSEEEEPQKIVRAPSEAAKLRAQARKQRAGQLAAPPKTKTKSSPNKTRSNAVQKRLAPAAPAPAPVVADLLDFGLPPVTTDPGPPPNPPSASPSPNIDLFKNMSVGDIAEPSEPPALPTQQPPATQQPKRMTSDDILSLFNTPPPAAAPMNPNMAFNMGMNNGMSNGMNNGMNNNMGMMMNNQSMQSNNMMMNNANNSMPQLSQMSQQNNNNNFFDGMQNMNNSNINNMNVMGNNSNGMNNMNMNGVQGQSFMAQSNNSGMTMQNQQQDLGLGSMAPMGGTPSNLTVMGSGNGNGMNLQGGDEIKNGSSFDFMGGSVMGGSATAVPGASGNPQMNQFASFGSFR